MDRTIIQIKPELPKMRKLKKVCAYARVSTQNDEMNHSLSAQVSYYNHYIQNQSDWLFCGVYADCAMTGTKDNRDEFQRMLEDCRAGKIDMVITKSISRFARNTVTLLETVRELKRLGIDVYFEEQNIHSMDGAGELMLTILGGFAQEESRSVSENQKWRIRHGFEQGELVNFRFLFGYRIHKGKVDVFQPEAEFVKEIFERFCNGESMSSIAADLDARGVRGVQGGKLNEQRIREILENEKYTGNALLMKHYRNNHIDKRKTKNLGEQPMYYAEETHPAIIGSETFNAAAQRLAEIKLKTKNTKPQKRYEYSGKIRCSCCGDNYIHRLSHGLEYWECRTYKTKGKQYCSSRRIGNDALNGLLSPYNQLKDVSFETDGTAMTVYTPDSGEVVLQCPKNSRADKWTPEMKEKARMKEMQRRAETHGR